jgi:hypothetical protein
MADTARPPSPARFIRWDLLSGRGGVVDGRGNAANPFRYRDAISPELIRGENRRSGAKPQGRNESSGSASGRPTAAATPPGVDANEAYRRRGHHRVNPTRGKCKPSGQLRGEALRIGSGALKARRRSRGTPPNRSHEQARGARVRETLRINPATGKGREGSSEGQRAATARDGRYRPGNGHGPAVP